MKVIKIIIATIILLGLAFFSWCCMVISSELSREEEYKEDKHKNK